jgi:hypothetical protein
MTPESHRRLRALGLTIRDFADACGLAPTTVSYWSRPRDHARGATTAPEPAWVSLLLTASERDPSLLARTAQRINQIVCNARPPGGAEAA